MFEEVFQRQFTLINVDYKLSLRIKHIKQNDSLTDYISELDSLLFGVLDMTEID